MSHVLLARNTHGDAMETVAVPTSFGDIGYDIRDDLTGGAVFVIRGHFSFFL